MTNKDRANNEYFEWLYDMVCGMRYSKEISYRKLLMYLHNTEFTYTIQRDENRAADGEDLRYRYYLMEGKDACVNEPSSVLEMMIALAIRCEETIMDDPNVGNRTGQWFWGMIRSLGLGSMNDVRFDRRVADDIITRFLNRDYDPDGRGGLFYIEDCERDLRTVEIWTQLCWYLNSII